MKHSAGLLVFRRRGSRVELLIAHPGGPLWAHRDKGAWSLVKGEVEPGESPIDVCRREFVEETGHEPPEGDLIELGEIRQKAGKRVEAWAIEGDIDPTAIDSMSFSLEWPPHSGREQVYPEIDRVAWVAPEEARRLLNPAQAEFVDRLLERLASS